MINRAAVFAVLMWVPLVTFGFGLGSITVDSALNAPFKAEIPLISVRGDEALDAKVRLASPAAFERAGLSRPYYLSKLRFKTVTQPDGSAVVRISSRESIKEPYLNFLLEVQIAGQSLLREYTVLLDPPIYTPPPVAVEKPASVKTVSTPKGSTVQNSGASSYGPVRASENLWTIASRLRPDNSVSVEQMMMALQRINPQAFSKGNVNLLKRGAVLSVPGMVEINRLDKSAARSEFMRQTRLWREGISLTKPEPSPEPVVAPSAKQMAADERPVEAPQDVASKKAGLPGEPLKVIETGEESKAKGIDRKGYPLAEQDKLREAISDSEENLSAVQDINKDIAELKTALEAKMEALRTALAEKDEAIAELKKRLEVPAPLPADESVAISQPVTSHQDPVAEEKVVGSQQPVVAQPQQQVVAESKEVMSIDVQAPVTTPPAKQWWKDPQLIIGLGLAGVLVLILLILLVRGSSGRRPEPILQPQEEELPSFKELEIADEKESADPDSFLKELFEEAPIENLEEVGDRQESTQAENDVTSVMTEVDIYLAYRRYTQAESLINEAMAEHPDNPDLQAKMLEIYAFKKDKQSFTGYLDKVGSQLKASAPDHWLKVVAMGEGLAPNHPLFTTDAAASEPESEPESPTSAGEVEISADPSIFEDDDIDIDLDVSIDDLIIHHDDVDASETPDKPQVGGPSNEIPSLDIDIDFDEDSDFTKS